MNTKLKDQIDKAITTDQPIKIRAYAILPVTECGMNYIAKTILKKYNRDDLLAPVYTSLKELALNGAKANVKTVLFKEQRIEMNNETDYARGMSMFKDELNEASIIQYATKAKEQNLMVEILYDYNPNRLIIEVINNRPISEKEETRIREKFKNAMKYDNIAQFYMDGGNSSDEGAGMGIILITMLLRGQGIDPHLFTIRSNHTDSTIAKVEFPISEYYQSSRDRYKIRKLKKTA